MDEKATLSYFDRAIGMLDGLPDVTRTAPRTIRVVPPFGLGSHLYSVQTFRQKEIGDTVFLEYVSEAGTVRLAIPPAVTDAILRQHDALTAKSRSRASKATAEARLAAGHKPGFMKRGAK